MGINRSFAQFLFYSRKKYAVSFDKTITLGRLKLYTAAEDIRRMTEKYGAAKQVQDIVFKDEYSEPLFELLGSTQPESMDYSDYEKATHLHDLNQPIAEQFKNEYDVVLDSGTLEHVFNFPVAVKSCMEMLKPGGHFIGITPANNYFGHGFYQFSPELHYRIFSAENGFTVRGMLVGVCGEDGEVEKWYEVKDPAEVRSRVMLVNSKPTYLFTIAQKTAVAAIFKASPYQSDYAATWQKGEEGKSGQAESGVKELYRKLVPGVVQKQVNKVRGWYSKPRLADEYIGMTNASHFKEVQL